MNNNKQTAVEILCNELTRLKFQFDSEMISITEYLQAKEQAEQNAKEIERYQHAQTWDAALDNLQARGENFVRAWEDFDNYYTETYEKL